MDELWEQVWDELRNELNRQPRCFEHPKYRCIRTLGKDVVNDILRVDIAGIEVQSHLTGNQNNVSASTFRAWWEHLQNHGTAALRPNDPNCPRTNRSVLVGAILARCLPNRIEYEGKQLRLLVGASQQDFQLPEEVSAEMARMEGATRTILINAYERDPKIRLQCIAAHGRDCCVCGFRFGAVYGKVGEGYIHVHHLNPLSQAGGAHAVDPVADLRPVCPNCHAMLHNRKPIFSIDELRAIIRKFS